MRLRSIQYAQNEGTPAEWRLDELVLRDINLIVGKNASGKSWTLNIVKGLASLMAAETKLTFTSGYYKAVFEDGASELQYELRFEQTRVTAESVKRDGVALLERGAGGRGTILATQLNQKIQFQAPEDELAAVVRRDSIQHDFLEPLHLWGKSLFYYPFGTSLGKDAFALFAANETVTNAKDARQVVRIFERASKEYGMEFQDSICIDMNRLGYQVDSVFLAPVNLQVNVPLPGVPMGIAVQETGISQPTDQNSMSQGMFRALSMVIQLNYGKLSHAASTIVIDDIGEGLDFERSCALIELVVEKAKSANIQLIMATNDRFVMNKVPIESWSVLKRMQNGSRVFNHANSGEIFDDFKFTGLNNFDFLSTDFIGNFEHANG